MEKVKLSEYTSHLREDCICLLSSSEHLSSECTKCFGISAEYFYDTVIH